MLNAVRIWILFSALLVSSGWILSACHELNCGGYLMIFAVAAIATVWQWRKQLPSRDDIRRAWHKIALRFRRPAPALFLALALLCLLGGLLYVSDNGDSNAYRTPRVLHWLGREQWHWIHTADARMNVVGSNFEWLCAPLILFTGTGRWFFLINMASYLMLPGLIFSVFTRLQVSPRTAWWWMWLLPSGWCFILQAGSDVNDSFAAVYALAMVDLALRGFERKKMSDLWLSILAAGLVTGVKQTNIPLGLLWFVAAWPGVRLLLARPIATAIVASAAILCSAVPNTVLNIKYTGNWQGSLLTTSVPHGGLVLWRLLGNLFSIPVQNLVPPVFPPADAWNRAMQHFVQTPFGSHFASFERFGNISAGIAQGQAGIGLGIFLLAMISLAGARRFSPAVPNKAERPAAHFLRWLWLTPWLLLLVFMAGICEFVGARLLAAYYPLLFPLLLAPQGSARLVRKRWWQWLGLLVMLVAVGMLVLSRNRPLFPEQTFIGKLAEKFPHSRIFPRIDDAFAGPRGIMEAENYFKNDIPATERIVGYATTTGMSEPGLWWPFGQRRVERVLSDDPPELLRSRGIHYVLVDDLALHAAGMTIEQWMERYNGEIADQQAFLQDRHKPPTHLYLVRFRPLAS